MNIVEQLQYSYMFFVKLLSFFYENNQKDLGAITHSSIFVHCYVSFGYDVFFLTLFLVKICYQKQKQSVQH